MIAEPLTHNQKRNLEWVIFKELEKGYEGADRTIGLRDAVTKWIELGLPTEKQTETSACCGAPVEDAGECPCWGPDCSTFHPKHRCSKCRHTCWLRKEGQLIERDIVKEVCGEKANLNIPRHEFGPKLDGVCNKCGHHLSEEGLSKACEESLLKQQDPQFDEAQQWAEQVSDLLGIRCPKPWHVMPDSTWMKVRR